MIDIFIDCDPPTVTKQQKRLHTWVKGVKIGRRGRLKADIGRAFFKGDAAQAAEQQFIRWFLPHAPAAPFEGPLRMEVAFVFPWRAQDQQRRLKGRLPAYVPKDTIPDTDNIVGLLKDTLTGCRYWNNDAQVCTERVDKGWGDRPGIHVRIMDYVPDYTPPVEDIPL